MTDATPVPAVQTCAHQWRYFVDVRTQAVRSRRCERCGVETAVAVAKLAVPVERISA